ncbi:hypothetical protein BH20ACT17_BH20ACT17_00250 [soil metagenome]
MHVGTTTGSYFDRCRVGVDELLDARTDMRAIEGTIDDYALDEEEKDALWLWASGRRSRHVSVASERPIVGCGDGHD